MRTAIVVDVPVPVDMSDDEFAQVQALVQDMVREVLKRRKDSAQNTGTSMSRAEVQRQLVELFLGDEGRLCSGAED